MGDVLDVPEKSELLFFEFDLNVCQKKIKDFSK
jgi:hypothetical protein